MGDKVGVERTDRRFLGYSLMLHFVLLVVLLFPVKQQLSLMPGVTASAPVIKAAAVSTATVQQQVHAVQVREQAIREAKQRRIAAANAAEKRRLEQVHLRKQREMAQQKAAKEKALALAREKAVALAKEKALAEKKAKQLAELNALAKQAADLQRQQQLQQLQQEQKQLKQVTYNQGIINQYQQRIAKSIGSYWLISRDVNKSLSCQFLIQLAPGGVVLDVRLSKSSGNAAFDRSAEVAVYKASPLPVPTDVALFGPFREFSLIVSPKTVMIRSPST